MTESTGQEIVAVTPDLLRDLLPAARKTSLLFRLSCMVLSGNPELEAMIRSRALSTQLLFVSSEKVLLKCVCTSDNLVKTLFPILKKAVDKNKPTIAEIYIEKAKGWIEEIVNATHEMEKRYDEEYKALAKATETISGIEQKIKDVPEEIKKLNKEHEILEETLKENAKKQKDKQEEINHAKQKLEEQIEHMRKDKKRIGLNFFFITIKHDGSSKEEDLASFNALKCNFDKHEAEMTNLKMKEDEIQKKMLDIKMKLIKLEMSTGCPPSPQHLEDIKKCLSRIQGVLTQICRFWGHVGERLDAVKKQTFAVEDLKNEIEDFKDEILESIRDAEKGWSKFSKSCNEAQQTFAIQASDSYKFLKLTTCALSDEERLKECEALTNQLKELNSQPSLEDESHNLRQETRCAVEEVD